jgi:Ca2+-binding RTX toxin-like protein
MRKLRTTLRPRAALILATMTALLAAVVPATQGAPAPAAPCAGSRAVPNALTTTSANGTVVQGSPCPDRIVVTSAGVREVRGGEGDDVIFANPEVEVVNGGEGDDAIYGELPETETGTGQPPALQPPGVQYSRRGDDDPLAVVSITEVKCKEKVSCYGGIGSQELIGSSGNDKIFGQRGNDVLKGNSGSDELFGGVGDESLISGGAGEDLLSGGLGADILNGNQDSDLVRGDGTTDTIEDTGAEGADTLSFATAVTPGFTGAVGISGFPGEGEGEERGVYVRLDGTAACGEYAACDNNARFGGGNDVVAVSGFENVIGSPFADYIVGSAVANRIDGGGGTDAIYGGEGSDTFYGGADADYLKGEGGTDTAYGQGGANNCSADTETQNQCAGSSEAVTQRDASKISVGFMASSAATPWVALYLTGSSGKDQVAASFGFEGPTGYVSFATEGESAQFDTSEGAQTEGCTYEATKVRCTLPKPLDAIVMAGMAGNDRLSVSITETFWETTTPIMLGGEGSDELLGSGHTEDLLVDGNGAGNDTLRAYAFDDGLLNNEGADTLEGGNGNDLLLSAGTCEGDTLQGAESGAADGLAQNSASFAKVLEGGSGLVADLESEGEWKGTAGSSYSAGPACAAGSLDKLRNVDDLEGTNNADILYGDSHENNLLGRPGKDQIWARGGNDNVEAKDGEAEEGGGGAGTDTCTLDGSDKFSSCNP